MRGVPSTRATVLAPCLDVQPDLHVGMRHLDILHYFSIEGHRIDEKPPT